jgi:hypothetical protein
VICSRLGQNLPSSRQSSLAIDRDGRLSALLGRSKCRSQTVPSLQNLRPFYLSSPGLLLTQQWRQVERPRQHPAGQNGAVDTEVAAHSPPFSALLFLLIPSHARDGGGLVHPCPVAPATAGLSAAGPRPLVISPSPFFAFPPPLLQHLNNARSRE